MAEIVKPRFDYITLLKCVAILMITNSHFKPVYPESLQALSVGGAWGCAIFFFCSGFTMANMRTDNFVGYLLKRLVRIYPAYWIFYILTGQLTSWDGLYGFFWPQLWFLQAILVFYVFFYPIVKYLKKYIPIIIALLLLAVIGLYVVSDHSKWMIDLVLDQHHITWYYYFAIMLFGCWLRNKKITPPVGFQTAL